MDRHTQASQTDSTIKTEMPWEDFDDGGGFDDDTALMGKHALFSERLSEAGFRVLLGFEESITA